MNITINVPDQLGETINQSPNRNDLELHDLKLIIDKHEQILKHESTSNKRQEMLAQIKKNKSILRGVSDQISKYSEEFRKDFAFNQEKQ